MSNEKEQRPARIANLGDRRNKAVAGAVHSAIMKDQPTMGGNQGDFVRPKCGTCLSWRRLPNAGQRNVPLNMGVCMFGPPTPHPVTDDTGRPVAQALARPFLSSDQEGCDQHDGGTDDEEGDGTEAPDSSILSTG